LGVVRPDRWLPQFRRHQAHIAGLEKCARQNLTRNWQDGRLWWNDPDAVTLSGDLPDSEFLFHSASIYASGGMVVSGDDLTKLPADRLDRLRKLSGLRVTCGVRGFSARRNRETPRALRGVSFQLE
jgi:hypothetical protein